MWTELNKDRLGVVVNMGSVRGLEYPDQLRHHQLLKEVIQFTYTTVQYQRNRRFGSWFSHAKVLAIGFYTDRLFINFFY
jgi:hypothetical protein